MREQIVEVGAVRPSANRAPDKREIALAEQLIGALEDRFDASEFRDEYQEQLKRYARRQSGGQGRAFPEGAEARAQPIR